MYIDFFRPTITGHELNYIRKVIEEGAIGSGGVYTTKVKEHLASLLQEEQIVMTTSCTHALEMAVQLLNISQDDEVLMPTFTFPSTANAVVLSGGKPVFIDVHPQTLQMDLDGLKKKITKQTKAILIVHYGGSSCDMDRLMAVAARHNLFVIEDAAQGLGATYKGKPLGTIGHLGCFSFHSTKNVGCGEGGALAINDNTLLYKKALILRDKGTDRQSFLEGQVDYYQWVHVGSSYVPSEMLMAYLYAQLLEMDKIQKRRKHIFEYYESAMKEILDDRILSYSSPTPANQQNYHLFFIQFKHVKDALAFKGFMKRKGIGTATHFVPLHDSIMGSKLGYQKGDFLHAKDLGKRVIRLPLYPDLKDEEIEYISTCIQTFFVEGVKRYG
ncbi:dTDP-4-amino-4,6-dideoxygalactose transaminase [Vallitalea okinawensis]|uniref:dTDP-4-amino-4,6-dideoxygalactose transaminase n=1 Tax=Vallitalea okinawensis TaxID=2078660 RepID=UPI000CFD1FBF|nr:dTDP-4-amino-4,6-dideoxygalactose transaminase [Vallitalea okinawensis]